MTGTDPGAGVFPSSTGAVDGGGILVLALGNDLLGDDGVGLLAARQLRDHAAASITVEETSEAGLALMEIMSGYDRVLILDAVMTGEVDPGTIVEFSAENFDRVVAPSPHYAGIPEVLDMSERLGIPFPGDIRILGMEVVNPFDFREGLSPAVGGALAEFVERALAILETWRD